MGVDADDVVGIEGLGRIPARLEFPVVQGMYLDIYESECLKFVYCIYCYKAVALLPCGSGFGVQGSVWDFADMKQGEWCWMLASVHALCLPSVTVQIFQT